jgi:type-F conjugative transfer system pilin assembly protein TrbC
MRQILVGCCLLATIFNMSGFCQTSVNQSWFNKKAEEKAELPNQQREDIHIQTLQDRIKDNQELKQRLKELENKERERWKKREEELIERDRTWQEGCKELEKKNQEFRKNWETKSKQSKEFFEKREKEFDQIRERLKEDLQRQREKQEQQEAEQMKEIIASQFRLKPQSIYANADLNSQGQCFNCSTANSFQDAKILIFMSFSVSDHSWISLSQELEKVGGTFVLRGLPSQSFQALANRILKLKEQGVNASIQLDPKSFLKFEIKQVPAIVVVEEQAFDKVSGLVSLQFALEKMAEYGDTQIAKTLYHSLKSQI